MARNEIPETLDIYSLRLLTFIPWDFYHVFPEISVGKENEFPGTEVPEKAVPEAEIPETEVPETHLENKSNTLR